MVSKNVRWFVLATLFVLTICSLLASLLLLVVHKAHGQSGQSCLVINEIAWAGTEASASDEWYELANLCGLPVDTAGWFLETTHDDGTVSVAMLPQVTIYGDYGEVGYALFERTDDNAVSNIQAAGIHGSCNNCGGSLVGIFPNTGALSVGLYNQDRTQYDLVINSDGEWIAGSPEPRASMQRGWQWYTSNHPANGVDANGNHILGTPGSENVPNVVSPETCEDWVLPEDFNYDLDITFEESSFQPTITLEATLWGVDANGKPVQTVGYAQVVWITSGTGGEWVAGAVWTEEEGTSESCLENLRDASTSYLNNNHVNNPITDTDTYGEWLDAIIDFQKSGFFTLNLPVVVSEIN